VLQTNGAGAPTWVAAAAGDVTLTGTQTLTNKTISGASNTVTNIPLSTAVTGTLPIANGGTNSTNTPTAGTVPYGTGTAFAFTSAGTSGQLLQSNGASAPTWVTASAGALTLLSTVTASNSATVDIETTFSSTYDRYIIEAIDIRSVDSGVIIGAQYKLSGAYVTNTTYAFHRMQPNDASAAYIGSALAAGAASSIGVTGASGRSQFTMHITNPTSTTLQKLVYWTGGSISSDAVTVRAGAGLNQGTGALTGVRFFASTGNISSGTFRLYGISN